MKSVAAKNKWKCVREFPGDEAPYIVPCKLGHLYRHGPRTYGASTNNPRAPRLRKIAEVVQDGDDGVNAIFPASRLKEVARIMRPLRRGAPA